MYRPCVIVIDIEQIIFCDGIFRTSRDPFVQCFCIHALIQQYKIPIAWAFLGGETEQHYGIMFLILRVKALEKFHENFSPEKLVSDFETGILSSARIHLPNGDQLRCYFPYTQRIYLKIQNLGLIIQYKTNNSFPRLVRKIFALPFLPL